jgi:glycosyltransferase involved in cell wall biosynthesis
MNQYLTTQPSTQAKNKNEQKCRTFLFIHRNAPAQFKHLIDHLSAAGHEVVFASQTRSCELPKAVQYFPLPEKPDGDKEKSKRSMKFEAALYQKFARKRAQGLNPDWIIVHTGWGLGLSLRSLFPAARILGYAEWWFELNMADFRYDPHNPDVQFPETFRLRMLERNRRFAYELLMADQIVAPTPWQQQQLPPRLREACTVIHDGIDTEFFSPEQRCSAQHWPQELASLPGAGTPLITYATRGMDPYRGFPEACRALADVLQRNPQVEVAIAGEDRVVYAPGQSHRRYGEEARARFAAAGVAERVHFVGHLPLEVYRQLLLRSDLHLYFSRPYVLSWSLLEAMACGCAIVASDVEPVRDVIRDGVHGRLVDHTAADLARRIEAALGDPAGQSHGQAARRRICRHFTRTQALATYDRLFDLEGTSHPLRPSLRPSDAI